MIRLLYSHRSLSRRSFCNVPFGNAYTSVVGDSSFATKTLPLQKRAAIIAAT